MPSLELEKEKMAERAFNQIRWKVNRTGTNSVYLSWDNMSKYRFDATAVFDSSDKIPMTKHFMVDSQDHSSRLLDRARMMPGEHEVSITPDSYVTDGGEQSTGVNGRALLPYTIK